MRFFVEILEGNEEPVDPEEAAYAIDNALANLHLENGKTLYVDSRQVWPLDDDEEVISAERAEVLAEYEQAMADARSEAASTVWGSMMANFGVPDFYHHPGPFNAGWYKEGGVV